MGVRIIRKKALVVEDYDSIRYLETLILQELGYNVRGLTSDSAAEYIAKKTSDKKIYAFVIHGHDGGTFPENCALNQNLKNVHLKESSMMEKLISYAVDLHRKQQFDGYLMISDCHTYCQTENSCFYKPLFESKKVIELGG